jgi:hypothetical protein
MKLHCSQTKQLASLACVAALTLAAGNLRADVLYNDTVDADLSNDYQNPTAVALPFGTNSVIVRSSVDGLGNLDLDFLKITLPAGSGLANIILGDHTGDSGTSFMGLQEGSAFTFDPDPNTGDPFLCLELCLGWTHFGPNEDFNGLGIGDDLMVGADDSTGLDNSVDPGFTPPLTAPEYTFWLQENSSNATYRLDFVVRPFGDYNGDGAINSADYTEWRNTLNGSVTQPHQGADGNGDTQITNADYLIWKNNYGLANPFSGVLGSGTGGVAVPEPSTCVLLLVGLVIGACGTRRRVPA